MPPRKERNAKRIRDYQEAIFLNNKNNESKLSGQMSPSSSVGKGSIESQENKKKEEERRHSSINLVIPQAKRVVLEKDAKKMSSKEKIEMDLEDTM